MIGLFVVAAVGLAVLMDLWDLLDTKKYGLTNVGSFLFLIDVNQADFLNIYRKPSSNILVLV